MRKAYIILAVVLFAALIVGCAQQDYASSANYNPQGQQGAVVGGGCGVGQMTDYESTPPVEPNAGF